MAVHLTAAEARKLGVQTKKTRKPTKRMPTKDCGALRCVACGYETKGETDEVRHMEEFGHHRYEMVL